MKLLNKIDKNTRTFVGVLAVIFSILILLNNPLSFADFPSNISGNGWFGLLLLFVGAWIIYDANK